MPYDGSIIGNISLFLALEEALTADLPDETWENVEQVIADVQIYLAALADRLVVEIGRAVARKMALDAEKYPADQVRGSARKYSEYN